MANQYSMQTARDIPLIITSAASSSERRVTPSWSIAQLKTKLEPVTGIPPSSQRLLLRVPNQPEAVLEAADEETVQLGSWQLVDYAEIHVVSLNPQTSNVIPSDLSSVPKYTMPAETYDALPSTVLAYKKAHHIGRFDPNATEIQQRKIHEAWEEIQNKKIIVDARCRVGGSDMRRGRVAFVGEMSEIPGVGPWIGVMLDDPVGKNDGSAGGRRYFECKPSCGVFVRPDKVEVGEFAPVGMDEELDSDMEEI